MRNQNVRLEHSFSRSIMKHRITGLVKSELWMKVWENCITININKEKKKFRMCLFYLC